jgi:acetyltransferase
LKDVPEAVDLAVIMLRADLVPGVMAECAALRIPGVVVLSGGFGETGPEGKERELDLVRTLSAGGGRMVGTNCAGLYSGSAQFNIIGWRSVAQGPIALVSQSGNMARTFAQQARATGSGFSRIITIGNAADLKPVDYIEYLFTDPDTKVIVAYLEGFGPGEGRALYSLLSEHPDRKPVVIVKPGATEAGRKAALSHTGSLAGEDRVVDAALRQCGAIRVHDTAEAWVAAVALAQLPRMKRSGVAVVSDGGGHATVVSDTAARVGLTVPTLDVQTQAEIAKLLPPRSACFNPVDFAGRAEEEPGIIPPAIAHCFEDEAVGGVIFAGHFGGYHKDRTEETERKETAAANELAALFRKHGKPFILHTVYGTERLHTLSALYDAGVPVFDSLENSAKAMAAVWRESSRQALRARAVEPARKDRGDVQAILGQARGNPPRLAEPEARALLKAYGIAVPEFRTVRTAEEARTAARDLAGVRPQKSGGQTLSVVGDAGRFVHCAEQS